MYRYCFPAGTRVLLADGTARAIETFVGGEWVLAAPDSDPAGKARPAQVARVFHNAPTRLVTVHTDAQAVRATGGHPFYAYGRGWIRADELTAGDRLRTAAGGWTVVTAVTESSEVERVYNLEVTGAHTYFVGQPDGEWILVHNTSGSIWDNIIDFFGKALDMAKSWVEDFFGHVLNGIKFYLTQIWQEVKPVVMPVVNWLNANVIQPVLDFVTPYAISAANAFNAAVTDPISAGLSQAWQSIKDTVRPYTDALADMAGIIAGGLNGELYKNAGKDWDYRALGYRVLETAAVIGLSAGAMYLGFGILSVAGSEVLGMALGGGLLQGGLSGLMAGLGGGRGSPLEQWGKGFAVGFMSGFVGGLVGGAGMEATQLLSGLAKAWIGEMAAGAVSWVGLAATGAASGFAGAYAGQSTEMALGMRQQLNTKELWAATVGGAAGMVAGAIATGLLTSGTMNAAGKVICGTDKLAFFAGHALGGALGGAAGALAEHWVKGGPFDWKGFAMAVGMGAVFGVAGANDAWQSRACFAAGTPLLTPDGERVIEQFRPGHLVVSRSEFDPEGPLEVKVVEEVFVRLGRLLHLHVGGQVIRTTAEHPFFVRGSGWVPAGELHIGDMLSSHDGQWMSVEDVLDTGEYETVYNLRVAEFHTYFVGARVWGFSVWSHNIACTNEILRESFLKAGLEPLEGRAVKMAKDMVTAKDWAGLRDYLTNPEKRGLPESKVNEALSNLYYKTDDNAIIMMKIAEGYGKAAESGTGPKEFTKPSAEAIDAALAKANVSPEEAAVIRRYLDEVYSNKKINWDNIAPEYSKDARSTVREFTRNHELVPAIEYKPGTDYAIFDAYAVKDIKNIDPNRVYEGTNAPFKHLSDDAQFGVLNRMIGEDRAGFTWHHHEDPGRMQLVPMGLHQVYAHEGGRSPGHWAEGNRLMAAGPEAGVGLAQAISLAPPVSLLGQLQPGIYTVSVDSQDAPVTADEFARINDALLSLDVGLISAGVTLRAAIPGRAADIAVHLAATSAIGSAADGVLGFTLGRSITLIDTWNLYTESDPKAIGAGQYDFQTVVEHELGHAVGLGHSMDPNSVMYASLAAGQARRSLTANDLGKGHQSGCTCPACMGALRVANATGSSSRSIPVLSPPSVVAAPGKEQPIADAAPPRSPAGTPSQLPLVPAIQGVPSALNPAVIQSIDSGRGELIPAAGIMENLVGSQLFRTDDGREVLLGGMGDEVILGGDGRAVLIGGFDGQQTPSSGADRSASPTTIAGFSANEWEHRDPLGESDTRSDSSALGQRDVTDRDGELVFEQALDLVFSSETGM